MSEYALKIEMLRQIFNVRATIATDGRDYGRLSSVEFAIFCLSRSQDLSSIFGNGIFADEASRYIWSQYETNMCSRRVEKRIR